MRLRTCAELSLAVLIMIVVSGCTFTGLTFGENAAGEDTYLEDYSPPSQTVDEDYIGQGEGWCVYNGSIAVDDRTDTAYTLVNTAMSECDELGGFDERTKKLYAIERGAHSPREILDLTGHSDARIIFPKDQLLVMSESEGHDTLIFLNNESYEELGRLETEARYNGTRLSSSRRFVAVADNTIDDAPIHIIDTEEASTVVVDHNGDWLEAMWLNQSDTLVAAVAHDWDGLFVCEDEGGCSFGNHCNDDTHLRIMTWSFEDSSASSIAADPAATWGNPGLNIDVENACVDMMLSFTWVGISPDDRYGIFPILGRVEEDEGFDEEWVHQLLVVDLQRGDVRRVNDARGPVGFTPDGSTIVSYRYYETTDPENPDIEWTHPALALIDVESLEETTVPLDMFYGGPEFYVTPKANMVVISTPFGSENLVIHDVDNGETIELETPSMQSLQEFVSRDHASELWMVEDGLFRLDYADSFLEEITLDFTPERINLLPHADLLILDDPQTARLVYVHPDDHTTLWDVPLPTP